ncbi:MAG TPA: phospholipase A [Pseudoxanthomonas sp.]|nr:phospholipase A [Pseudoxanthomonas sp.]
MPSPLPQLSLLACAVCAGGHAVAHTAPQAATPEACVAIEVDATRLACYDAALLRKASDPAAADAAAQAAAEERVRQIEANAPDRDAPLRERARHRLGAVFASDPPYEDMRANAGKGSLLDSRWELAKDSKLGVFQMRAYKPVYLMPAFWSSDPNEAPSSPNPDNTVLDPENLSSVETKFQISFKTKFAENLFGDNGDLWGAYTQNSRWQVYNAGQSRPFRETNYEPEVMLVFRNNYRLGGWRGRMAGISLNHQSNGRGDPLSRSWNRVILSAGIDREDWAFVVRPWWRISDGSDDDNPDMEDFMGRGDAMLVYSKNGHEFAVLGRHSLRGGDKSHGALQLDWGFPIDRTLRGHVQVFHGYGESMIDYNHKATYVGLGISLLEWF